MLRSFSRAQGGPGSISLLPEVVGKDLGLLEADETLIKPFTEKDLRQLARRWLSESDVRAPVLRFDVASVMPGGTGAWEVDEPSTTPPWENPAARWAKHISRVTWEEDGLIATTIESSELSVDELIDVARGTVPRAVQE